MHHKEPRKQKNSGYDPLPKEGMTQQKAERLATTPVAKKPRKSGMPQ